MDASETPLSATSSDTRMLYLLDMDSIAIQPGTLILLGVLLLALVTVESGGYFLTRVVRGHVPVNRLQQNFFRAGHAHAAVLLVLSMVILSVISYAAIDGFWMQLARLG